MKQTIIFFRTPTYLVIGLVLSVVMGCATATTQRTGQLVEKRTLPQPPVLLIHDFTVAPDDAPLTAEIERERVIAKSFSETVVRKLEAVGIAAQRATGSTTVPLHALVVKGRFITIQEGSRARRMVVGFGLGSTMLRVQVQAYQMMENGLQRITDAEGEARGNRMPGMALSAGTAALSGSAVPMFISGALATVREIRGDLQSDIDRLAERFAYKTIEFYRRQGWS